MHLICIFHKVNTIPWIPPLTPALIRCYAANNLFPADSASIAAAALFSY